MSEGNYYSILEVKTTASEREIKSAYKKLALLYHPDKNLDNVEEAERLFKLLNEAYDCLKDSEKRRVYDLAHKLQTKETGKPEEVIGLVMNIQSRNNKVCIFTLRDEKGNDDTYIYNGFFPIEEGDSVYGVFSKMSGQRVFSSMPFVQISVDKDSIKRCFITALRGTGFGEVMADKLYLSLQDSAKMCGYVEERDISVSQVPSSAVIAYMSSVSMKYVETKNEDFIVNFKLGTGLKEYQIKKLLEWWHRKRSLRRLHLFGINNTEIKACCKGIDKIYEICMSNPFRLAPIALEKGQRILYSMNKEVDEVDLLCGKINHFIYEKLIQNRWPSVPHFVLNKLYPIYQAYKDELEENYDLKFDTVGRCIYGYFSYSYEVETYVTEYLDKLIKRTVNVYKKLIEEDTAEVETNTYIMKTLTDEQKLAIQGGLEHHVSLITGSAGTGKSNTVREIVNNLEIRQIPYCIASFTGKAVSRVNQILKKKGIAATLDRLIAKPPTVKFKYLIIDEISMVTTELFYRFIRTFTHSYRIIFIGDENQLPPISWGNLLYGIKRSERIPTFRLTENKRIMNGNINDSIILGNANKLIDEDRLINIKKNQSVEPIFFSEGDGFLQLDEPIEFVKDLIQQHKDQGVSENELVILSPYNENLKELNEYVQSVYFLKNKVKTYVNVVDNEKTLYCVGDRVMMLHNNYDINVMNGTEGIVKKILLPGEEGKKDGGLYVDFSVFVNNEFETKDEDVFFSFKCNVDEKAYANPIQRKGGKMGEAVENEEIEINELNVSHIAHSFAITINKSQGSEYKFVIIYVGRKKNLSENYVSNFLNLNRLYTAITRTIKFCFLIGDPAVISAATCKVEMCKYDNLGERLFLMKDEENESIMNSLTVYKGTNVIEDAPFYGDLSEFDEFDDD
jgi:hypothetical protein